MTWQSGGGAKGIPGLTSDGSNGIVVAGGISAGDPTTGSLMTLTGTVEIDDVSNINAPTLFIRQLAGSVGVFGNRSALYVQRGAQSGSPINRAVVTIENDDVGSFADTIQYFSPDGNHDAVLNVQGGAGLLGHSAPTAPRTLAQSVITAITDANTKTAIQAIADALSDSGQLTLT